MADLKPCPNPECHGRARVLETLSWSSESRKGFFVQCYLCDMRGPTITREEARDQHLAKAKARELWDALTPKPEPVEPEHKCPHCGGEATGNAVPWRHGEFWCCQQQGCRASSPERHTAAEAYDAWWEPFEQRDYLRRRYGTQRETGNQ